jgi:hypothetical protein
MSDLIGGIGAVTLSDEEARRRGTQKTVLERKAPPTFDVVIEMISRDEMAIRRPVAEVVDAILRGLDALPETRTRDENGEIIVRAAPEIPAPQARDASNSERFRNGGERRRSNANTRSSRGTRRAREARPRPLERDDDEYSQPRATSGVLPKRHAVSATSIEDDETSRDETSYDETSQNESLRDETARVISAEAPIDVSRVRAIYPFGISRSRLARAVKQLGLPLAIARRWQEADAVLLLVGSSGLAEDSSFLREARELGLPLIGVRGNTYAQILARLNALYGEADGPSSPRELAIKEARDAAQHVLEHAAPAELRPQIKPLRRVQHQMAEKFHLRSYSVGREPNRRVRFLPRLAR